jgi:hypothetical protein
LKKNEDSKYLLVPLHGKERGCHSKCFAKIHADHHDTAMNQEAMSFESYNVFLNDLSDRKRVDLLVINPRDHKRGFVVVLLGDDECAPDSSEICFSNEEVRIFKEVRSHAFQDCDLEAGTVMYRGFPWLFRGNIEVGDLEFLDIMHGKKGGMLDSRPGVAMSGYFSYTGPRASSQSSASPIEYNSYGHDLHTEQYCPLTYPLGVKLGKLLCAQSDKMMNQCGNTMMHLVMEFERLHQGEQHNLNYSKICHNRIVTKWFASVSVIFNYCIIVIVLIYTNESCIHQSLNYDNSQFIRIKMTMQVIPSPAASWLLLKAMMKNIIMMTD